MIPAKRQECRKELSFNAAPETIESRVLCTGGEYLWQAKSMRR
jgi:hypothetical protein